MLTCSRCRTVQPPAPFCSTCGTSLMLGGTTAAIPPPPMPQTRTSGMAITGFVLSFFCGVLGVIFSLIGLLECRKSKGKVTGDGLAIAGIAVSILTTIASIFLWVWFTRFTERVERIGDKIRAEEARIELQKMSYRVKSIYTEYGELPTSMAPMTPSGSCCGRPDDRCRGDFETPAWKKINFELYGQQHFRYSYSSTPHSFQATAVGDLDCDGDEIVYRLEMTVRDGVLEHTIIEPTEED